MRARIIEHFLSGWYTDHAQYTIKTYAKMALFRLDLDLVLTGPLSTAQGSAEGHWVVDTVLKIYRRCSLLVIKYGKVPL